MEIEIRYIGEKLEPVLRECDLYPAETIPLVASRGAPTGGTNYTRHLTVWSKDVIIIAAEDDYESENGSAVLRSLATLHKLKAIRIKSINGINVADNNSTNVEWTEREMQAIAQLSEDSELSRTRVLQQALRLYQDHHYRVKAGLRQVWLNEKGEQVVEPGGCGGED